MSPLKVAQLSPACEAVIRHALAGHQLNASQIRTLDREVEKETCAQARVGPFVGPGAGTFGRWTRIESLSDGRIAVGWVAENGDRGSGTYYPDTRTGVWGLHYLQQLVDYVIEEDLG